MISSVELDIWFDVAVRDLPQQLVSVLSQGLAHVRNALFNYVNEQRRDLIEEAVFHVVIPGTDKNAVVRLYYEVVADVVDDDRFVELAAQQGEVLHEEGPVLARVLPIEPVFYVLAHVDLVNYLVGVLLHRRGKDHNLVVLRHRLNELDATRPHKEKAFLTVLDKREINTL